MERERAPHKDAPCAALGRAEAGCVVHDGVHHGCQSHVQGIERPRSMRAHEQLGRGGGGETAQWEAACFSSLDGGGEVIIDGMD